MSRSDLVLLAYIFLIVPAMLVGFMFARRKMFEPYHKVTMTIILIVNWILIFFVMLGTYSRDVAPELPQNIGFPGVLIPTIHLIPGLIAQLIGTYLVIRMWFDKWLPASIKVNNIKPWMRLTLGLWLTTAVLGVLTWAIINKGLFSSAPPVPTPGTTSGVVVRMISGNKFDPEELTITTGTTVEFINADTRLHTVAADDESFDSGSMKAGATFKHTFNKPGDFPYYCDFHGGPERSGMSAIIHVTGQAVQGATEEVTAPTAVSTTPPAPTAESTQAASSGEVVTVVMTDNEFSPKEITVAPGTTVRWENQGKRKHTVTADDSSFDSDQIPAGGSFEHQFTQVGDVPLYCTNHGGAGGVDMAMVVHVKAGGGDTGTSATTAATAESVSGIPTNTAVAFSPEITDALNSLVVSAKDTPSNTAYVIGAQSQMSIIIAQAALINDSLKEGRIEDAQAAAEAILNAIQGEGKDRDSDGKVNQLGDSNGLQKYIFSISESADTLKGSDALKATADQIITTGQAVLTDIADVTKNAQAILDSKTLVAALNVEIPLTNAVTKLDGDIAKIISSAIALNVTDSRLTPVPSK